jgi:hypothetical protein
MNKFFTLSFLLFILHLTSQRTVGLVDYQTPNTEGYVLFAPMGSTTTYLINKCGKKVHEWQSSYRPGLSAYLLPDGNLLRTGITNNNIFTSGGSGGAIEKFGWNGNLLWQYFISDSNQCQHHDVCALPNGNVLAIVWEQHTGADAIANGKDTTKTNAYLWSEKIIELQPVGNDSATIIWQWRVWDHLIQQYDASKLNYGTLSQHPELLNINYFSGPPGSYDWLHFNSIDYNDSLNQILISAHNLCEVFVIDHSTTTVQAASHTGGNSNHGGDILYRWGNPQVYGRGNPSNKKLYSQHHASWIPYNYPNGGKILVFNNGLNRPGGNYTSVDMIDPPIDANGNYSITGNSAFLPTSLTWTYTASTPADFYASNIGGAYPLSNGSFMITEGPAGIFFEIDSSKNTKWKYVNPVSSAGTLSQGDTSGNKNVFRCNFYPPDYSAFTGFSLTPYGEVELNPLSISICDSLATGVEENNLENNTAVFPNPATEKIFLNLSDAENFSVEITNTTGALVAERKNETAIDVTSLSSGVYFLKINQREKSKTLKLIKY